VWTWWDADFSCLVPLDSTDVEIFVQATPTACGGFTGAEYAVWPSFDTRVFYRDAEGLVWETDGRYLWGGRHHIDSIQLELGGTIYVIAHSSLGSFMHPCAPPDCLLPCPAGSTFDTCDEYAGFSVDGCERDTGDPPPPLPVICVAVNADGSVPPLVDPWMGQGGAPPRPAGCGRLVATGPPPPELLDVR
jgi:hypothetical protein